MRDIEKKHTVCIKACYILSKQRSKFCLCNCQKALCRNWSDGWSRQVSIGRADGYWKYYHQLSPQRHFRAIFFKFFKRIPHFIPFDMGGVQLDCFWMHLPQLTGAIFPCIKWCLVWNCSRIGKKLLPFLLLANSKKLFIETLFYWLLLLALVDPFPNRILLGPVNFCFILYTTRQPSKKG